MRITNAPASRKRRQRTVRAAKGFRMRRSKLYRYAADALLVTVVCSVLYKNNLPAGLADRSHLF